MDAFRRNFNSRDRLEYAIPGIKITYQGIPIQKEGPKMYKVEFRRESIFTTCLPAIVLPDLRLLASLQDFFRQPEQILVFLLRFRQH